MNLQKQILNIYTKLNKIKNIEKKKLIFSIGNTVKIDSKDYYFTPVRIHEDLIIFGIIVFKDKYAKICSKVLDGKVDYIMVDAEKKIRPQKNNVPANIERRVREAVKKTKLIIYKGNDLTVDSIDLFLTYYFNKNIRGLGGKKILIIGAGNIGSKLAQILLERGSRVFINRRNHKKNLQISKTINFLKPKNTLEKIYPVKDINKTCKNTDILIGSTSGKPVINKEMMSAIKSNAIVIDAGKGTVNKEALIIAKERNIKIFRTDVTAALLGLIYKSVAMQKISNKNYDLKKYDEHTLITQGLLGAKGDIVVDDVHKPNSIYGICNGKGDFFRELNTNQKKILKKVRLKFNLK